MNISIWPSPPAPTTFDCYYFGCWNEAGHYLFAPHRAFIPSAEDRLVAFFNKGTRHIDGTLAPRKLNRSGIIVWSGYYEKNSEEYRQAQYYAEECPQGQFLRHALDNGFTAVQWWDRNQGDRRGACNSTILLRGDHTSTKVLEAGRMGFPHVFENLERAKVELVELALTLAEPVADR